MWSYPRKITASSPTKPAHQPETDVPPQKTKDSRASWATRKPASRSDEADNLVVSSIRMEGTITIEVDHRETWPVVEALDSHPQIEVVQCQLDLGDFCVVGDEGNKLLIERKCCTEGDRARTDFEQSIVGDGRLFDQSERLMLARENAQNRIVPVFLIEGDVYSNSQSMLVQQIDGALSFLASIQQVNVLTSLSANHSAYIIAKLATHFALGLFDPVVLHKAKPKMVDEQKIYILQSMPGISRNLAIALLEAFGSVAAVAQASDAALSGVAGMGPKRVHALRQALS